MLHEEMHHKSHIKLRNFAKIHDWVIDDEVIHLDNIYSRYHNQLGFKITIIRELYGSKRNEKT